ncbi:MAG: hypothetical protein U1A28_03345, partial [Patescibacteria group bacterium]|nr:hypothetical protein [Patescibacteria group bacterium]
MREIARALHNMSSSSRSTAYVKPRRVESPPTLAHGASVRSNRGVTISLRTSADEESFLKGLHDEILLGALCTTIEEDLRDIANRTVIEHGLIGCVLVHLYSGTLSKATSLRSLTCPKLKLALLSKSSDRLFVASKTPNLSISLLYRE